MTFPSAPKVSYPVQGGTELAEEQKKVHVTARHVLSVLQPETVCAYRALRLVHFQAPLTDPKLTTAITSIAKKNCLETMVWP